MENQSFKRSLSFQRIRSSLTPSFWTSKNQVMSMAKIRSLIGRGPLSMRNLQWLRNHRNDPSKKTRQECLIMKNSINEVSTHLSL